MAKIVRLRPEDDRDAPVPPTYLLEFTQKEFPEFLANPTGTMSDLGHPVKNLVVLVKDHLWDSVKREWITEGTDEIIRELPAVQNWRWVCGYQDEQCVCERVLGLPM